MTTVLELRQRGYDCVHLRDRDLIKLPDPKIVDLAIEEGRAVLTFDLDFGALMAKFGTNSPSVILFRLRDQSPASVNSKLLAVVRDCVEALISGSLIVVDDSGYRIRRLPIQPPR
ncbi:MAG: DUF5615 family PIN-like protein [Bryobacteraceae bacterium]|nr:DUF5615 family PIN-like protein [Bryobacteraceae bacterium]